LAACGKEQFAYEHPTQPNGVFTYALMKVLNEISVESLTYTSLMHRLNMPKWWVLSLSLVAIAKLNFDVWFHHQAKCAL
jgi:hypothetical protein